MLLDDVSLNSLIGMVIPFAIQAIIALAIFILGRWVARFATGLVGKLMKKNGMDAMLIKLVEKVVYVALLGVVVLAAIDQLGIDTTSALAIFGAAGLAVGLALKDSLSNFAAGVMLILHRPFSVGDFVEVSGVSGKVFEVSLISTVLITGDNRRIIIPNGIVYSDKIVNHSAEDTRRVDVIFGIGYDDDMATAQKLIMEVMKGDPRILADPEPAIALAELADSSVNLAARPWAKTEDYWAVKGDLMKNVKQAFDANGISIPYPQQDLHVHQIADAD
jgi:small conductance mechanosensitive channel